MSGSIALAGGNVEVGSINGPSARLTLWSSGSTLTITDATSPSHLKDLTVQYLAGPTTLTGAGTVDISGSLSWTGGYMTGSGKTVLEASATSTIDPGSGSSAHIAGRTLQNEGTLTLASGSLDGTESAELDNSGTFNLNADAPGSEWWTRGLTKSDGSSVWLHNTGTVRKATGDVFGQIAWQIDNEGTVEAKTGQLIVSGGNHGATEQAGRWAGVEGASISFNGGAYVFGSAELAGTIVMAGATVKAEALQGPSSTLWLWAGGSTLELTGTTTASHLGTLNVPYSATLTGAGTLAIENMLSWASGSMTGPGKTVLAPGANGSIDPGAGNAVSLNERDLVNHGTLTFSSGSIEGRANAELDNTGTLIDNAQVSGAEWSTHGMLKADGSSVWLHNTGTIKKTEGSTFAQIQFQIDNEGAIEVASAGQLIFSGGNHGSTAQNGAWTAGEAGQLSFNAGSYTFASNVPLSGELILASASIHAEDLQGEHATLVLLSTGTTLDLTGATTSHIGGLQLDPGSTLTGPGSIAVTHSLTWTAPGTMSGSGATLIAPGATATAEAGSGCEPVHLQERDLINKGTFTLASGTMSLSTGAQITNEGVLNDSSETSCEGAQLQVSSGGATPSILNTGTFEKTTGTGTGTVAVHFGNEGHVEAQSGRLAFADGGTPGDIAVGSWAVAGEGRIALTGGTFLIGEEVDLSHVEVTGATVERRSTGGPPAGYLYAHPVASRTVAIAGTGASIGSGFASARIELSPAASSEWKGLCGPLTPSLVGEYECEWDTTSSAYPDGAYQLRAQLSDASTPPNTAPTSAITVLVDNTPPTGSFTAPEYISRTTAISGTATDTGSGLASWQLQIAPAASAEWANACAAQSTPASGDEYRCSPSLTGYSEGSYSLRTLITDNAGNTFATAATTTVLDATPPTGTLAELSESSNLTGSLQLTGTAGDSGSGVASWTPQIAPAGTREWSELCTPQTAPTSGSSYGCELDTTGHADGHYQFRALITDKVGNSYTTTVQEFAIDNTPPVGELDYLPRTSSGAIEIHGAASDATSGIASWTLQIAPADQDTWQQACLPQMMPDEGSEYGCSLDTASYTDGAYQLRAVITDNAGHTYTTLAIPLRIANSEIVESSCTDTWTGGAENTSWQASANWSAATVPTSSDIACLPTGTTVHITSDTHAVGWIEGNGNLVISGGSLAVTDTAIHSNVNSLTVENATLTGRGELDINNSLELNGATLSGTGKTVLEPEGSGTIETATLSARTLTNHGTVNWNAGAIITEHDAHLENTGTFHVNDDGPHCGWGCIGVGIQPGPGSGTLENAEGGQILKSAGDPTHINIPFDNQGAVKTTAGEIQLNGGGIPSDTAAGSWTAEGPSSLIEFNGGSFNLAPNTPMHGAAAVTAGTLTSSALEAKDAQIAIEGGTLNLNGAPSTIETLNVGKGPSGTNPESTLGGSGQVNISHSLELNEGTLTGASPVVIGTGATATADPFVATHLSARKLVNEGAFSWDSGAIVTEHGGEIENAGTIVANDDGPHCGWGCVGLGIQAGPGGGTFENTSTGTITKTAGATSYIAIPFNNDGHVAPAAGEIQFSAGGIPGKTATGSWTSASKALIEFAGGDFNLASETTMSGPIAITAGTLDTASLNAQHASVAIEDATLKLDGTVPSELESLSVGKGPNGASQNSELTGTADIQVTNTFEWSDGIISGTGTLALEPGSTGTIDPFVQAILVSKTLINYGTLKWQSGRLVGASGGKLLNEDSFATNDTYGAECYPGYCRGMQTAEWLTATFGEHYFEGRYSNHTTFTGAGAFVNEGSVTDPESSCPDQPNVEITWETRGEGEFNDDCSAYSIKQLPTPPAIVGVPEEGQTLSATTGSWESVPYPTFTYQWQRCGGEPHEGEINAMIEEGAEAEEEIVSPGTDCTNIAGATGADYTPSAVDVGQSLRVAVTANKRLRSQTVTSEATRTVTAPWHEEPEPLEEEGEAAMYPDPETEGEATSLSAMFATPFGNATYKETLCPSTSPCGKFKGAVAAAYGYRWVLAGESDEELTLNHNQDYYYYGGDGGDCTNFVSQALKAGGMRFMRAHGHNSPDGGGQSHEEEDAHIFLEGPGAWWNYFNTIPLESSETYVRSYAPSAAFVRAKALYAHLLDYGLARKVKAHEAVRPGDVVFYDLYHPSLEADKIDHAALVVKVSADGTVMVAQHSPSYVHSLAYIVRNKESHEGPVGVDWNYVILEPVHTAANI